MFWNINKSSNKNYGQDIVYRGCITSKKGREEMNKNCSNCCCSGNNNNWGCGKTNKNNWGNCEEKKQENKFYCCCYEKEEEKEHNGCGCGMNNYSYNQFDNKFHNWY